MAKSKSYTGTPIGNVMHLPPVTWVDVRDLTVKELVDLINNLKVPSQKKLMRALRDGAKTQQSYFKVSMERQPLIRYRNH